MKKKGRRRRQTRPVTRLWKTSRSTPSPLASLIPPLLPPPRWSRRRGLVPKKFLLWVIFVSDPFFFTFVDDISFPLFVCLVEQVPIPETPRLPTLEKSVKPPSNATPSKAGDARFVEPLPKTPSLGFKTPLLGAKEPPVKSVATPRGLTSSTLSGGRGRSNDDEVDSHAGGGGGGDSMNTVVNLLKSISEKIDQIPPAASPALSWMSSSRTPSKIRGEGSESVRATPLKKRGIFLFLLLFFFWFFNGLIFCTFR